MEKKAIPPGVITDKPELIGVKRMIDSYSNLAANFGKESYSPWGNN
nr:MAG TPA: hypothetical protein [Caudoviricetes sp.]